jgi:hypothetical protein
MNEVFLVLPSRYSRWPVWAYIKIDTDCSLNGTQKSVSDRYHRDLFYRLPFGVTNNCPISDSWIEYPMSVTQATLYMFHRNLCPDYRCRTSQPICRIVPLRLHISQVLCEFFITRRRAPRAWSNRVFFLRKLQTWLVFASLARSAFSFRHSIQSAERIEV